MATLTGKQLKDSYQSLVTIKDADDANPTSGQLENGLGNPITALGIGTDSPTDVLNISSASNQIGLDTGDQTTYGTLDVGHFTNGAFIGTQAGSNTVSDLLRLGTSGTERMKVHSSGDISFRDGSANEAFYWDASAGSLQIGSTTSDESSLFVYKDDSTYPAITVRQDGSAPIQKWQGASGAEKMRIDSSGNVGIGVTPEAWTVFNPVLRIKNAGTGGGGALAGTGVDNFRMFANTYYDGAYKRLGTGFATQYEQGSGTHVWSTASSGAGDSTITWSESMRIDSSGNLLVGKNTSGLANAGIECAIDTIRGTKTGSAPLELNRLSNDGAIALFWKDTTLVGSIGTSVGSTYIGGSGDGAIYFNGTADIRPWNKSTQANLDNSIDLGVSSARFQDIYATNGTIQTSDRNEKQDIEELDDAELRVAQKAKTLLRKFRWKSSVEEKENARIHFGIIAQDLEQAFTDEGLDAGRYGMFIKSTWTNEEGEEQTRLGVRYNQLLAFIISAL
jgi:hypothetical protein